jgi:DNA-binding NarL/FixJ family response regulator
MTSCSSEMPVRVLRIMIVDDHPALCEGLSHRIESQTDMTVCGQAADVAGALRQIDDLEPDLVIVDIGLKGSSGLDLIKTLKTTRPGVLSLVHSMYEESLYAERCLAIGARGYVNKEAHPDDVIQAIREILAGRIYLSAALQSQILNRPASVGAPRTAVVESLSERQLEIFRLIGQGKSAAQIASLLVISVNTVDSHRENIKRKLNVSSAPELVRLAVLWMANEG